MLVLGIHMGHDAAVAVVEDGRILSLTEKERRTRVKHAAIAEIDDIELALADAGCGIGDIDFVAITATQNWPFLFYDTDAFRFDFDPDRATDLRLSPVVRDSLRGTLDRAREMRPHAAEALRLINSGSHGQSEALARRIDFDSPAVDLIQNIEWTTSPAYWDRNASLGDLRAMPPDALNQMLTRFWDVQFAHAPVTAWLRGRRIPGAVVPHHLAHAAGAFFQSDRDSAAISTCDGGFRREYYGYAGGLFFLGQGNKLRPLLPNFLTSGNMYNRVARFLELGPGQGGPGKLMGLAPYGAPRFFDPAMVGNLYDNEPAMLRLDDPDDPGGRRMATARHLVERATRLGDQLGYDHLKPTRQTVLSRFSKDLAASAQKTFEEQNLLAALTLFEIAGKLGHTERNLCLSGGAALNCPANSRVWREGPFERVFVPPTCDDSGLAIGSALYLTHAVFDRPRQPQGAGTSTSAHLGRRHSRDSVDRAVRETGGRVRVTEVGDGAADAARALAGNRVVAWYEGRSEVGPRALGHRSILADPRDHGNWERVNRIKNREAWRPFAPAVLEEHAADWFDGAPLPSPFMLFTARVRSRELPAITHVDGSARIQTVARDCGGFRDLLEGFNRETGVPVVLNTSFNGPGEPIVESPEDAVRFFETSELDHLYLPGYRLDRS